MEEKGPCISDQVLIEETTVLKTNITENLLAFPSNGGKRKYSFP